MAEVASGLALWPLACAGAVERAKTPELPDVEPDLPVPPGIDERFAELRGFCDGVPAVSREEHRFRRVRARQLLATSKASTLVLEAGVDLEYFTGVRWGRSERPLLWAQSTEGKQVFVGPAFERGRLEESIPAEAELLTWQEHEDPYGRLVDYLQRHRGSTVPPISVGPAMRRFVSEGLRTACGAGALPSGRDVVDGCRMIKTGLELSRLRRANEATKASLAAAARHVEPGMDEAAVADLVRSAQQAAGLSEVWVLALAGPSAAFPHGTRDRQVLEGGDLVLVDTGGALHGYRSDITRTWPIPGGTVADEPRRAWDAVLAAQSAALVQIRAGRRCEEADAAARAVIGDLGFGDNYEHFTHRLGHGIGLEVHERPYLVRGNVRQLDPAMTMSNEPGIYVAGSFGVRLEDIVCVTEEAAEVFGPRAKSLDAPFG